MTYLLEMQWHKECVLCYSPPRINPVQVSKHPKRKELYRNVFMCVCVGWGVGGGVQYSSLRSIFTWGCKNVWGSFILKYLNKFKTILERKLAMNSININKTNNCLSSQAIFFKTTTYRAGNSYSGLGQAHKWDRVKPIN